MRRLTAFLPLTALSLVLLVSACAPRATTPSSALDTPEARQLEQTAAIAYHRMEIGLLQTGEYTTNALIDLELPQGAKWTLEEFSSADYLLRFTSSEAPGYAWLVTPGGVRAVSGAG